jgi:AsmA-like C-terminal region/AsmA family
MHKRKWLRWILILAIVLFAASMGFSRALRTSAARRFLIAHLEASFGRPVEVRRFDFSLLDGARLEANSITIAEDPRFGDEYFLRADTLRAGLRWSALFAGRFEFGTLSLSRPSLNLVRNSQGRWNIEQWLPPAAPDKARSAFVGPSATARSVPTARLYRIAVDGGRINFKQGDEKSPVALVGVSGRVDQDAAGRWALDLEAAPMRAGVELQQIGTLRVRGNIAGTSARLQPAELNLTWSNVSLADALRLTRDSDLGVRGELSVDLSARVAPVNPDAKAATAGGAQWSITGGARLTGFHGWRLPGRGTDPAANLSFAAAWRLGEARTQVPKFLLEMPNSHLQGAGELDWTHGLRPELRIDSSSVGFADLLAWYRSLRPGVPANLEFAGKLGVDATLGGWPLQLVQGAFSSAGGRLTGASLPSPVKIGAISAKVSKGALDIAPTEISFAAPAAGSATASAAADNASANSFTVRAMIFPDSSAMFQRRPNWNLTIEGGTPRVENWLALSEALAQPLSASWTATGGLAVSVKAVHLAQSPATAWLGTIDSRNLDVTAPYLNQPLRFARARIDFAKSQRTFILSAAQAFGTTWRGTAVRNNNDAQWTFDLSADRVDAADLDRWLGPRARPGLLARLTGLSGKPAAGNSGRDAAIAKIAAHGRLRISEVVLAPLHVEQFDGQAELAGRSITIRKAYAGFFGGKAAGTFVARLLPDPSYEFEGRFDRVDLARLGNALPSLSDRFTGLASATLTLSAHGIGREGLVRSIQGDGKLEARNVTVRDLDFATLISGDNQDSQTGRFASVQGNFRVARSGIEMSDFVFDNSQGSFQAEGRIDFSHALALRIHPSIFHAATTLASAPPPSFVLGGTIESPSVVPSPRPDRLPAKPIARAR